MKWGKGIAVLLVLLMLVGLFCRVPVALAVTQYTPNPLTVTTGPIKMYYENYNNTAYIVLRTCASDGNQSSYPSYQESGSTCTATFGGYTTGAGKWGWKQGSSSTVMDGWYVRINVPSGFLPDSWNNASVAFSVNMSVSMTGQTPYTDMRAAGSWVYSGMVACPNMADSSYGTVDVTSTPPYSVPTVAVTGTATVPVNSTGNYTATITGGEAPFTGHWTCTGLVNSLGPTATVTGTTSVLPWTFGAAVGLQTFRYDVTDSHGSTAYGSLQVMVGAYAPDLKGQLYMIAGEVRFCLYPAAQNPVGEYVEPGSETVINTEYYTIDRPQTGLTWAYYILADVPPLANPYVVHATYTDPTNGRQYMYTFSFDTTGFDANGDWVQGDGSKGSGELPSWLNVFTTMLKDALKWLFVPNEAKMKALFGTTAETGTAYSPISGLSAGGLTWKYQITWRGQSMTLMDFDLSTIPEATWALCRTVVGALVGGAEIILLISLL